MVLLFLHPAFVMPVGPMSNWGLGGLVTLILAAGLAWWAFHSNPNRWVRRIV